MGTSRIGFPVGSFRPFRASDFCCVPNPRAALRFALGYPLAPRWGIKAIWRRTWCLTPMWNPQCLTSDYASNDDFEGEREIKFKLFYYY